jgi:RNA polymerase sigma-70 factor (ECF subfamily)
MKDKSIVISSWVDLYTSKLLQWAIYKLKDKDLAQDLVQDTFVVAFETYNNFRENSKPLTWLIGILNNKISTQLRAFAKFKTSELQAEQFSDDMFVEDGHWNKKENFGVWQEDKQLLDNPLFIKIFEACTAKLPENWREILFQKFIFEKDSKEICQEHNLSDTNYWQLIHRSKLLMRKCIEKSWET